MGCFLGCFGASKDDKKRHKIAHLPHHNPNSGKQYSPINQTPAAKQVLIEEPINSFVSELGVKPLEGKLSPTNKFRDKQGEESSVGARKKVTFDSKVKEYEHVSCDEAPEDEEKEVDITKLGKSPCTSECSSTLSSVGSFPPNHRYQNYRDSDDDDDELCCEVSDLDDDEEDGLVDEDDEEEAYEAEYSDDDYYSRRVSEISTRSCSLDSETKSSVTFAANESLHEETKIPLEFNRGARDRAAYINSVLNPVENTAQWKHLKAKRTSSLKPQKENILKSKPAENGPENNYSVAVDASLSTWLSSTAKTSPTEPMSVVSEQMSSNGSNSAVPGEERPILGALTMEELKQISPRRSPARNPNEKPLLGTVGMHWTRVQDSISASSFKFTPETTKKFKDVVSSDI